jgi:hypothetical protein
MAHTRLTSHQPTSQLAPQDVPPPQEPQHNAPPCASQEEEPFEIELVVPGSPVAQGAPTEEHQEEEDHNVDNEDEVDEEYSPSSDNEGKKFYRDAGVRESFGAEAPIPTGRFCALLGHLGITSAPRYKIRESRVQGYLPFMILAT